MELLRSIVDLPEPSDLLKFDNTDEIRLCVLTTAGVASIGFPSLVKMKIYIAESQLPRYSYFYMSNGEMIFEGKTAEQVNREILEMPSRIGVHGNDISLDGKIFYSATILGPVTVFEVRDGRIFSMFSKSTIPVSVIDTRMINCLLYHVKNRYVSG